MVGAFPKAGFVVGAVWGSVGKDGPEPLAVGAVKEDVNYIAIRFYRYIDC